MALGLDKFDLLLEAVLSLVRVSGTLKAEAPRNYMHHFILRFALLAVC